MKVVKEDMEGHLRKILALAKHLQAWDPGLEDLQVDINKLQEMELSIMFEAQGDIGMDVIKTLQLAQRMQDLEQQVLKEKIESLALRLEEDKEALKARSHSALSTPYVRVSTDWDEEFLAMREFLDQNKDLLGQLGPQVDKLNVIQEKVEQHDVQLGVLEGKVDHLEKAAGNHLFEEAKKKDWPDPVFSSIPEAQGYRGQVMVKGQMFTGSRVHHKLVDSHQEVARIALEQLRVQSSGTEEVSPTLHQADQSASTSTDQSASTSTDQSASTSTDQSASTSAGLRFYNVTVSLQTDMGLSEGHCGNEEAVESAYGKLASQFGVNVSVLGASCKAAVLEHFSRCGFRPPEEQLHLGADGKVYCRLGLSGPFTFHGQEGALKIKQAEQQAAKVAILQLAGVLGYVDVAGGNYKSALKELLEANRLEPPVYRAQTGETGGEREREGAQPGPVSKAETMATPPVDSVQLPPHRKEPKMESPGAAVPDSTAASMMATVPPSESDLTPSSDSDVSGFAAGVQGAAAGQTTVSATPSQPYESPAPQV
ncbi:hypothetical protein AAFF_G00365130 [Aldrovandia affinis]|uniref:DRBM domain-containing protein n=1 Tax=Aldrovandia affinis TaxID=143900 RepID=A0AAD7R4U0_9TELE|nr:hypothetical protein AAFF_G00365130 [Aldrovandia affinis]